MNWVRGKRLGEGSFGWVDMALPKSPSSPLLAVKSTAIKDCWSLQRESRILERLFGCDEIIKCYGESLSLEFDTPIYNLLLEYAPGGSLLDLMIQYNDRIPELYVQRYTRMILKGLSFMHHRQIVHCDLKPENILVFPSDEGLTRLKIADFGLAKELGEDQTDLKKREASKFRGDPYYMSPESVKDRVIEPALDIWSLGCIVLEMISGQPTWGDYIDLKELYNYLVDEKEGRSPVIPDDIPENAKDFLNRCLDRDYKTRWKADMLLNHPFMTNKEDEVVTFGQLESRRKQNFTR